MTSRSPAAKIGFAKVWQDIITSAAIQYQLWFGAGLFLRNFLAVLIIIFLFIIAAGQTNFKTPTFGNAKRKQRNPEF